MLPAGPSSAAAAAVAGSSFASAAAVLVLPAASLGTAELASPAAAGNTQPAAAAAVAVAAASRKAAVGAEVWLVAEQRGPGAVPVMPAGVLTPAWLVAALKLVAVLLFAEGHLQGVKADHCPGQQALEAELLLGLWVSS